MVDTLTAEERSRRMALVKSKDTKPEMRVRKLIYGMGYRYRLHSRTLPGNPDLVFAGRRKVIFVHGCFWHQHHCAMGDRIPKSRVPFWRKKLAQNQQRDCVVQRQLKQAGWDVAVVWECETGPKHLDQLIYKLRLFLNSSIQCR